MFADGHPQSRPPKFRKSTTEVVIGSTAPGRKFGDELGGVMGRRSAMHMASAKDDDRCPVCRGSMEIRRLPCGHEVHRKCADALNGVCPICDAAFGGRRRPRSKSQKGRKARISRSRSAKRKSTRA